MSSYPWPIRPKSLLTVAAVLAMTSRVGAAPEGGGIRSAPMRYGVPRAVEVHLDMAKEPDPSGALALKGTVKPLLADLGGVHLKFVLGDHFKEVDPLPTRDTTLTKDQTVEMTARIKTLPGLDGEGVGFHVEFDYPVEAALAYVATHPEKYPNESEKAHLVENIKSLQGVKQTEAGTAWRAEP